VIRANAWVFVDLSLIFIIIIDFSPFL